MPETDTIPVSASVASTGKGIRYVGNWAYGYSGSVSVNGTETDLLNMQIGSGFIVAIVQFNYIEASGDDFKYSIYLNDLVVQGYFVGGSGATTTADNFIKLLVPPLTSVRCTAQNIASGTTREQAVSFVGRVYGAE